MFFFFSAKLNTYITGNRAHVIRGCQGYTYATADDKIDLFHKSKLSQDLEQVIINCLVKKIAEEFRQM